MRKLDVWITFPDSDIIKSGEMVTTDPDDRGVIRGAFRYRSNYLTHSKAFALDPITLPLKSAEFQTHRPSGVHAVFEDALPDDWGRRLLVRKAELAKGQQTIFNLLMALGGNGLGALSFTVADQTSELTPAADMIDLGALVETALQYDAGRSVSHQELQLLFQAASSPGGARPKALIKDESGSHCLAKFPSTRDTVAICPIEAATLQLARDAGLTVPDFYIKQIGRHPVLIIKRFDISGQKGRYHMISGQTLLQAEGYYNLSYTHLFEVIKKYSSRPLSDIPGFFRQMVFNAAIGNTDDHLKNFCMLHDDTGYFLSPVYDVLPDTFQRREHVLYFQYNHLPPDRKIVTMLGKNWGVKKADDIIDEVVHCVSKWCDVFNGYNVPKTDIDLLMPNIEKRLQKLGK